MNTKWERVDDGKVTVYWEELVHLSNDDNIILKATDRKNFYANLSSVECKWGNSVDNVNFYFEYGTWKSISEETSTSTTSSTNSTTTTLTTATTTTTVSTATEEIISALPRTGLSFIN